MSWISNYLTDRYQMTYANGVQSTLLPVTCGVPQGSILGPTFYLIYVNDIEVSLRNSKVWLYADYTVMYVSAPSPNHACTLLQRDLDKLSNWREKNQPTVNTSKTKAMLFGMRHVIKSTPPLTLVLNDEKLQFVESYKYLGATLDNLLDFELHAKTTVKLVSHKIKIFSKIRGYLNERQALMIYKTKILPYFDYADILCIGSYQRTLKKLQKQQNRVLRICLRLGYRSKVNGLHKMAKIELLSNRHKSHQMSRLLKYITSKIVCLIYKQTILPICEYADQLVESGLSEKVSRLQSLQDKAVRIIDNNEHRGVGTEGLNNFFRMDFLKLRRAEHLACSMYRLSTDASRVKLYVQGIIQVNE